MLGSGWGGGKTYRVNLGGRKRTAECALQNHFWRPQKLGLVWSVPLSFNKGNDRESPKRGGKTYRRWGFKNGKNVFGEGFLRRIYGMFSTPLSFPPPLAALWTCYRMLLSCFCHFFAGLFLAGRVNLIQHPKSKLNCIFDRSPLVAWAMRNAIRANRFAQIAFAIETPIFIARQADSHEPLEFPIRANHLIRAIRANRTTKTENYYLINCGVPQVRRVKMICPDTQACYSRPFVGTVTTVAGKKYIDIIVVESCPGNCHLFWSLFRQDLLHLKYLQNKKQ